MTSTDESEQNTSRTSNGKFAVLAMFGVALLLATFAWWWNLQRGRESLKFFGAAGAQLIRTAPTVEILVPLIDKNAGEPASAAMRMYGPQAVRRVDVSQARGLIHARTSLLNDSSYDQNAPPWSHVTTCFIRFRNDTSEILLGFTEPDGAIQIVESGEYRPLIQKTADGWRQFIERNIGRKPGDVSPDLTKPPAPARKAPSE